MANAARWSLRIFQFAVDEGAIDTNPVRKVPPPSAAPTPTGPATRPSAAPSPPRRPAGCWPVSRCSGGTTSSPCSAPACASASSPACAAAASTSTSPSRPSRSSTCATRPAASSAAASSPAPRATPASARSPWPPRWSRRSAASSHPAATHRPGCSPAPAAAPAPRRGPGVKKGTRTVLSRHNFRRTYHGALAKLADPATAGLRPTAARVLRALRDHGPLTADQLAAPLASQGRPPSGHHRPRPGRAGWRPTPPPPTRTVSSAGGRAGRPRSRCWRRSTCTAPTTSATPSRPGWRTPASRPGSSTS